jgi:hypothetical protein
MQLGVIRRRLSGRFSGSRADRTNSIAWACRRVMRLDWGAAARRDICWRKLPKPRGCKIRIFGAISRLRTGRSSETARHRTRPR